MKAYAITIMLLLIVVGCRQEPQPRARMEKVGPRTEMGSPMKAESLANYHLRYKTWSGMSSGAGFTRTSLRAVELDLSKGRIRRVRKTASRPEPMLPHDDAAVAKLLEQAEWTDLAAAEALVFQKAIQAWLDTKPPAEYNSPMALGREDGHVTSLSVAWDGNTVTSTLNPRTQSRENDPLRPSAQWKTLIGLLGVDHEAARGML